MVSLEGSEAAPHELPGQNRFTRLRTAPNRKVWWRRATREAPSLEEFVDPEIEAAPADERARLAAIWQKRGGLELRVASNFSSLAVELFEHGATPDVYGIVARAVRDE